MAPGFLSRAANAAQYLVTGKAGFLGNGGEWFGPQAPIAQQAPDDVKGRRYDFVEGKNLSIQPREYERVSFGRLWHMYRTCDLVELAVQKRIDQALSFDWSIKPRDVKGRSAARKDPRVAEVTAMLEKPDGANDYGQWIRQLLEQLLVIDAPTLYRRNDRKGRFLWAEIMDGSTFKPVLWVDGRRPAPPYPAYQQILKGLPAVDYTADEVIYYPRNPSANRDYGRSPVEQAIGYIDIAVRRMASQLAYFSDGTDVPGFLGLPKEWTVEQLRQYAEFYDARLAGQLGERRKMQFVPGETAFKEMRPPPLKDDFDEWLARVICFAFSLPPTPFVKQMSRSTSETQQEATQDEGLAPLLRWIKLLLDKIIREWMGYGDLEFVFQPKTELEADVQAKIDSEDIAAGVRSRDEVRDTRGWDPLPNGEGSVVTVTTPGGVFTLESVVNPPEAVEPAPEMPDETASPGPAGAGGPRDAGADDGKNRPKPAPAGEGAAKPGKEAAEGGATPFAKAADGDDTDEDRRTAQRHRDETEAAIAALMLAWWRRYLPVLSDDIGTRWAALSAHQVLAQTELDAMVTEVTEQARLAVPPPIDKMAEILARASDASAEWAGQAAGAEADQAIADAASGAATAARKRAIELFGLRRGDGGQLIADPGAQHAVDGTTRNMVRSIVAAALADGLDFAELAKRLADSYAFSASRAEAVGVTEAGDTWNGTALLVYLAAGVTWVAWATMGDDAVEEICLANEAASPVPIGTPFPSGHLCPTAHTRCRCWLIGAKPPAGSNLDRDRSMALGVLNKILGVDVDTAAMQAHPQPTPAQASAGNYRMGHVRIHGLDVTIENARWSLRRGVGADGRPWVSELPAHYGYVRGTEGADGDHVDVFIGPDPASTQVWVIDQIDLATGKFDEHKCMLGFPNEALALATYRWAFQDGRGAARIGAVTEMTIDRFKAWLRDGDTAAPAA